MLVPDKLYSGFVYRTCETGSQTGCSGYADNVQGRAGSLSRYYVEAKRLCEQRDHDRCCIVSNKATQSEVVGYVDGIPRQSTSVN